VRDPASGAITTPADYSQLGVLLLIVSGVAVVLPLLAVALVQRSQLRSTD
jgi:hypothetical protein